MAKTTLFIGVTGVVISAYLAYILLFVLNDMCIVCFAIYFINAILLIICLLYYRTLKSLLVLQTVNPHPPAEVVKKRV